MVITNQPREAGTTNFVNKMKNNKIIINKFGGDIMSSPEKIKLAIQEITNQIKNGQKPIMVVSALKGITDELVEVLKKVAISKNFFLNSFVKKISQAHHNFCQNILKNPGKLLEKIDRFLEEMEDDLKTLQKYGDIKIVKDKILSCGEIPASYIFATLLEDAGVKAKSLTGGEIGIITDNNFMDANIIWEKSADRVQKNLNKLITQKLVPVITGFNGKTSMGQITTLGRGGSDTTATFLGAVLNSYKIKLWKSVPGVLSADPRIVKQAKTISKITYNEAEESGQVLHDKAIRFLKKSDIEAEVCFVKDSKIKTIIKREFKDKKGVKMINSKENLTLLEVRSPQVEQYGFLYKISEMISRRGINMVLIRNTRDALYIVIENSQESPGLYKEIEEFGSRLKTEEVAMVSLVGNLEWSLANKFNQLLIKLNHHPAMGAFPYRECVRMEALINPKNVERTVRALHKEMIG